MKKITKMIAMLLLGVLLCSTTAFAAEVNTPVNEIERRETQTISDYIVEVKRCSSSQGVIIAAVGCSYSVSWEEGVAGWINNANFMMDSVHIGDTEYSAKPDGVSWRSGSSLYQRYKANGISILLSVTCDEWGNVSLGMIEG